MPHVVIIGAGAAGTMAAIFAAARGAETTLLERTGDGGRKILISGGGRCNILPSSVDESRFVTDSSKNTLRRILRSWPLREQIRFFEEEAGIPLFEERESQKLFPKSESARDVRDKLLALARAKGALIRTNALVTAIVPTSTHWSVEIHNQARLEADAVIVATGGLSVPNTGSDGGGLQIAQHLGHVVNQTYPALTPLTANGHFTKLAGVSLPVAITAKTSHRSAAATGGFLFTHRGYSGPAVLDVSHVAVRSKLNESAPAEIAVKWADLNEERWQEALRPVATRSVLTAVSAHLPTRLAEALIEHSGVDPKRALANMTRDERLRLIATFTRTNLPWDGDEGYKKAEVTGGGVHLAEIDPSTMESKRHPGLFLCGEMLDAFGPIGGYNFLWAWATGRAAGEGAAATR